MTDRAIRQYAKKNYLHGKTRQETLDELTKVSHRTTTYLEKKIHAIPSISKNKYYLCKMNLNDANSEVANDNRGTARVFGGGARTITACLRGALPLPRTKQKTYKCLIIKP